jgi:hypothetical protein
MAHGIGTAVTYRKEAWQVVGVRDRTRELLSLDGTRRTFVAVDHLVEAP